MLTPPVLKILQMKNPLSILIIEQEQNSCKEIQDFLKGEGFFVRLLQSIEEAHPILQNNSTDILIIEICLPDSESLDLVKNYKSSFPGLEVIVISGYGDMDSVIQAMRLRVLDFLLKPLCLTDLRAAIERSQRIQVM